MRLATWQSGFPEGAALLGTTIPELYQRWPKVTMAGRPGFMLGIIPQLGRNRFESPSLPDSENLTEQRQRRDT